MKTRFLTALVMACALNFGQAQVGKDIPSKKQTTEIQYLQKGQTSAIKKTITKQKENTPSSNTQEQEKYYNIRITVELTGMTFTIGDRKNERIGFNVAGEFFRGTVGKGKVRILCANKNGDNGCRSTQFVTRGRTVNYSNRKVILDQRAVKMSSMMENVVFGVDYLGFYEKHLYSDKTMTNYYKAKVVNVKNLKKSIYDGTLIPNPVSFVADLKSQEVVFTGNIYYEIKERGIYN